jgi:hypothetical protein
MLRTTAQVDGVGSSGTRTNWRTLFPSMLLQKQHAVRVAVEQGQIGGRKRLAWHHALGVVR